VEITVPESIRVAVEEPSQTGEARRLARGLAHGISLDETRVEQIAIVVTEACTNLLKHASSGEILLRTTADSGDALPSFEVLALDRGPGIANLDQCLRDGFSTGGSAGQGLGAIVRLSTESDFYTNLKNGTAVLARWSPPPSKGRDVSHSNILQIGAVNVCKPGQEVCGDSWGVEQEGDISVVMVADGLGHGIEAKQASMEAIRTLRLNPNLGVAALIERVHQALRSFRGAAVAVARIDRHRRTVAFSGLGNISAQIYSGSQPGQHLVSVNGTAGHQVHKIREFMYPWPEGGILVMHSDGLLTGTGLQGHTGLALRDPSLIAGVLYRDFTRRNDDATVVVAKAA
jgi:anti-sigma regulatory factor (Ser/Thr protein kinase)